MATIRRARSYATYVLALAVSSIFSLFGRTGPVWAEEAVGERSAKVFHESISGDPAPLYAQAQVKVLQRPDRSYTFENTPWPTDYSYPQNAPLFQYLSPGAKESFTNKFQGVFSDVESRVKGGQGVTESDVIFLQQVENQMVLDNLSKQVNDLATQVDILTKLLKEKEAK
jgi:hypothetical protein